ncbi:sugar phosphate isomerase/epimerase [uncultured Aquimarina sp.]|uniref:sugar phosphate isomerase/epimerase family protein n=1 Tax=uncultured Aquimarina sp. TaxID=575652 RepID=UPI00262D79A8|nr:sugar phosphate isomerase/epimerase [uncultured Aquimarina sp.]
MNRRKFIKTGAISSASILAYPSMNFHNTTNYKLGYQLFSIRDRMKTDPLDTLKKLKLAGYQDFEIYGYDATKNKIYGFSPKEFYTILNDLGLTVSSGHYGFSDYLNKSDVVLEKYVDKCIVAAKELKSKYITWPWLDPKQRTIENFKLLSSKLNKIGEQVYKSGLGFAYHNHGFEFEKHNGTSGYQIILNETDSALVKLQLDIYWVMHSSDKTPKEIVASQSGRIVMWHIKDMDKQTRDYTELGNGSINYKEELPDPKQSGLDFFYIEQGGNFTVNSMQSAIDSANYFNKNLKAKL